MKTYANIVNGRPVLSERTFESRNPATGEVLGQVDIPDKAFIAPVVADNMVYILTDDGTLTALK